MNTARRRREAQQLDALFRVEKTAPPLGRRTVRRQRLTQQALVPAERVADATQGHDERRWLCIPLALARVVLIVARADFHGVVQRSVEGVAPQADAAEFRLVRCGGLEAELDNVFAEVVEAPRVRAGGRGGEAQSPAPVAQGGNGVEVLLAQHDGEVGGGVLEALRCVVSENCAEMRAINVPGQHLDDAAGRAAQMRNVCIGGQHVVRGVGIVAKVQFALLAKLVGGLVSLGDQVRKSLAQVHGHGAWERVPGFWGAEILHSLYAENDKNRFFSSF